MCSKFKPPISGGAPSNVGPNTIDKLDIDIEFVAESSWILHSQPLVIQTPVGRTCSDVP